MKKILSLMLAVMMVLSMAVSAFAFAPSAGSDDVNDVVESVVVKDANGNTVAIKDGAIEITPAVSASQEVKEIYAGLANGTIKLPYGKVGFDAEDMEVIAVFEALLKDPELAALLDKGVEVEVTFDLGVAKDAKVTIMVLNEKGEWIPVEVVNNGDGTVTGTFNFFGTIAISLYKPESNPSTGAGVFFGMAALVCAAAVAFKK